jgi:hypothetical protein
MRDKHYERSCPILSTASLEYSGVGSMEGHWSQGVADPLQGDLLRLER